MTARRLVMKYNENEPKSLSQGWLKINVSMVTSERSEYTEIEQ